jgi:hypothetical protein
VAAHGQPLRRVVRRQSIQAMSVALEQRIVPFPTASPIGSSATPMKKAKRKTDARRRTPRASLPMGRSVAPLGLPWRRPRQVQRPVPRGDERGARPEDAARHPGSAAVNRASALCLTWRCGLFEQCFVKRQTCCERLHRLGADQFDRNEAALAGRVFGACQPLVRVPARREGGPPPLRETWRRDWRWPALRSVLE